MKCRQAVLVFFLFSLAVLPITAQLGSNPSRCTIRVDVLSAAGGHAPGGLQVQLQQAMTNFPVAMNLTNDSGTAEFANLSPGQYRVRVSGEGIKTATSGVIEVNDWNVFMNATVVVQDAGRQGGQVNSGAAVAVTDLNVPKKAGQEYDRGNHEMAKKHWSKAIDHFKKAIAIHPQYSAAYNNMAVAYGEMGERDRQREALQKAISANDHCVAALVNLAHLDVADKQISPADDLLHKAVAADPTNVEALSLLAEVDVQEGHYQEAIQNAKKVHSLPHEHYAFVHYTAASAYEREGMIPEAIAELKVYLQENPRGPRADRVRQIIPAMEKEAKEAQNRTSP